MGARQVLRLHAACLPHPTCKPLLRGPPPRHLQDLVLFNDSIYYNINYGRLDASKPEVEAAAKQVGKRGGVGGAT